MSRCFVVLALVLGLSACFTHRVHVGSGGDREVHSSWDFYFLNGWLGNSTVNVNSLCPSGNATVEIKQTIVDSCIGYGLCGALMVPQTTKVYCGGDRSALEDRELKELLAKKGVREALEAEILAKHGY